MVYHVNSILLCIKSTKMKKIIIAIIVFSSLFSVSSNAQDSTEQKQLSRLLDSYYSIKDALVAGNGTIASVKAQDFIRVVNGIDYKIISEGNINALLKDATPISETTDIKKQRGYFANFSNNMITVAKAVKLTDKPVYLEYCPMKKSSWLSNEGSIKNPYYGSAMLTCGQVVETLNK